MESEQAHYIRCRCSCHANETFCDVCVREHASTSELPRAVSPSSTATIDDKPGAGRGMDKVYQFLGSHLECQMGVMMDRLGFGPAAAERRALGAVEKLGVYFRYVQRWRRKKVVQVLTAAEVLQLEKELERCCKMLAGYLRSPVPATQLAALNAVWKLRCADPVRVDSIFGDLGMYDLVETIHTFVGSIKRRRLSLGEIVVAWRSEYVRPYNGDDLDSLLASSRKALIAVKDNELHSAAKSLVQLKGGYNVWISNRYSHVAPRLQTLSKYLLDTDLGFMAVAYVGRLGMRHNSFAADESMFAVSASIVQTLRAVCSFHADRLSAEGQALPDVYWDVMENLEEIDELKVFLPIETQRLISAAPMEVDSSIAVDWKDLERAIDQAWEWLYLELVTAARLEGYHKFLERQPREITGISRRVLEDLDHYACAECVDKNRCEYWEEAFECFVRGGINENEVLEEFQRNSEESYRAYALAQMSEWQKRTVFTHGHGKRIRWLKECSV